jgi:DNA-binding transcriptional LysR family regulator
LNIRSLRALVKLGENGCDFGIHKQLGIPRSTLWACINEIERETGLRFVVRKKQNNILTEEGKDFLPYAKRMIKIFEEGIEQATNSESETPSGEIIISTTTAIASSWLMESICSFQESYPKIHLKIIADDYISTTTEMVADILMRPISEKDFLVRRWSIAYTLALWASPQYLEKYGTPEKPSDLLTHSILGYGEHVFSYSPDIDWHLKGRWCDLPRLTPSLTINSTKALYAAAQQGIGICSAALSSNVFYHGNLVRVLPEIEGPTVCSYFCTKKEMSQKLERNVSIFNSFFLNYLKKMGVVINDEQN